MYLNEWHKMTQVWVQEIVENLSKGDLPKTDYSCMNDPSPSIPPSTSHLSMRKNAPAASATPERKTPAKSMRSRRTANWAKSNSSDDGSSRYTL